MGFRVKSITPQRAVLSWGIPESEKHGILTGFTITYGRKGDTEMKTRNFHSEDTLGTINDLIPGQTYTFKIQAKTQIGYGSVVELEETAPIWRKCFHDFHFLAISCKRYYLMRSYKFTPS